MKKFIVLLVAVAISGNLLAAGPPASYVTQRASGTIMISGSGAYQTDLSEELRSSFWTIGTDAALFLFPQFAGGIEFGYYKQMNEMGDPEDPTIVENVTMSLGPRVYFFFGGKWSEFTPFIKGGANYLVNKQLIDDEENWRDDQEMGLTASAGVLLNLARNVGLTVEAEYNFEKGSDVEEIDTQQLLIKFGIRSFLGE